MGKVWGSPLFQKISTKLVAGFIAVVAVLALLGIVVSNEASDLRTASSEALAKLEGQHLQQAELALADQSQAQYEHYQQARQSYPGRVEPYQGASRDRRVDLEARIQPGELSAGSAPPP